VKSNMLNADWVYDKFPFQASFSIGEGQDEAIKMGICPPPADLYNKIFIYLFKYLTL